MIDLTISLSVLSALAIFSLIIAGVKVVPQSEVFVVERFGKYTKTLPAGLNVIVPVLDRVAHRVIVLERQLEDFEISVITSDNVEVKLKSTVFYRVKDASKSVYRIDNVDHAINTAATSIVRSAAGRLDLDALQSSREGMNNEIASNLSNAAEVWGIEVTRTEIIDIIIDEVTKEAQRQQLNADRQRRATVAEAEGQKRSVELAAEAQLFEAQKQAEAIRLTADANAYAVKVAAEADANQIMQVSESINRDGKNAVDFEILKRQVQALGELSSSNQTKTLIIPSDITKVLGSLEVFLDHSQNRKG